MSDRVQILQELLYWRFFYSPWFSDIVIKKGDDGINQADIAKTLGSLTERNGKKGVLIVVDRPFRDVTAPNLAGPEWNLRIPIGIYEHVTANRGNGGTLKRSEEVISQTAALFHLFQVGWLNLDVTLANDAVTPVPSADKSQLISEIILQTKLNQPVEPKVSSPLIKGTADAVIINAGQFLGPSIGAAVWYTTDGSYPSPENPTATRYGIVILSEDGRPILSEDGQPLISDNTPAPLNVAPGTVVQANAWKNGLMHSDLSGKQF